MRTVTIKPTSDQLRFHKLKSKYPAFVGGFGVGKSQTMANQAFMDASHSSDALIALYEPTYDLIRLIMAPRMESILSDYGVRYKYNKSENIIYTSTPGLGDFILRTLDNPERIVGYESYRSHVDEIDTLKEEHARAAWIKIIARNRQSARFKGNELDEDTLFSLNAYERRGLLYKNDTHEPIGIDGAPMNRVSVYTTPEGFRFVYKTWKKEPKPSYEMVQASTLNNPFLPGDYVASLRESYPANLIDAYLDGEFVNLTSGQVYTAFNRNHNHSDEYWDNKEAIHIGMDFNVGRMCSVVHVLRDHDGVLLPHAVDEITAGYDTPDMIRMIKQRFWDEVEDNVFKKKCEIYVYPDSSGKNRKSVGASDTDISLLKDAGFRVRVNTVNPSVRDRVTTMNSMFCNAKGERKYFVNPRKCPTYVDKLEQQVYKNGEPEKDGTEDVNDAGGYYIAYEYKVKKPMLNINVQF